MKATRLKHSVLLILFVIGSRVSLPARSIDLDRNKLKESIKEMLAEKLSEKILETVTVAEQKLRDDTYFNEILEDFRYLGIDPENTLFTTKILEIYNRYKQGYEKSRKEKAASPDEKKRHIRELLLRDLESTIMSSLDQPSQEIIEGLSSLLKEGKEKISSINQAVAEVSASDVDTDITDILEKYGLSGDWVFRFKELETNIKSIRQKYGDYYRAYSIISEGMNSKNPGNKIHALFILGSEFGGKIPVLGKFVELYFTVGLAYLDACSRLSESIRNREQYCVGAGAHAQIEGWGEDLRSKIFSRSFPGSFSACPLGPSGIYRDIYKNMDQGQGNRLYFWITDKKRFLEGNPGQAGETDIHEIVKWLRKNRYPEKATSVEFLSRAYNTAPGFSAYRKKAEKLVEYIRSSIRFIDDRLGCCDQPAVKDLIMNRGGAGFISLLLANQKIDWPDIKKFNRHLAGEIVDRLIHWKFIRGNRDYLHRFEEMKGKLDRIQPVEINGYVRDAGGKFLENVNLTVFPESRIFNIPGSCLRLTTNESGVFGFFLLMDKDSSMELSLQARATYDASEKKNLLVMANQYPVYTLTLIMKSKVREKQGAVIQPGFVHLKIGQSVTFSVYESKPGGRQLDLSWLARWSPSRQFTAREKGSFTVEAEFPEGSPYAGERLTASISVNRTIRSIKIEPDRSTLRLNETCLFYATATYDDNTRGDITSEAVWNPGSRFTARKTGTFDITASLQGITGRRRITVEEPRPTGEEQENFLADPCTELENKFREALKAGNLAGAQLCLALAVNCDFYSSGFATLQLTRERQEENHDSLAAARDFCRELNANITTALQKKNFLLARSLLREGESRGCAIPAIIREAINSGLQDRPDKKEEKQPSRIQPAGEDLTGIWDTTGGWVIDIKKTGINTYSGILVRIYASKSTGLKRGEPVLKATRTGRDHYTLYIAYRIPAGKKWMKGSGILQGDRLTAGRRVWKRISSREVIRR